MNDVSNEKNHWDKKTLRKEISRARGANVRAMKYLRSKHTCSLLSPLVLLLGILFHFADKKPTAAACKLIEQFPI